MAKAKRGTLIQQSRRVSPQDKAVFHAVVGAGKSRVVRNFFDVGPGDEQAIQRLIEARVDARLKAGG